MDFKTYILWLVLASSGLFLVDLAWSRGHDVHRICCKIMIHERCILKVVFLSASDFDTQEVHNANVFCCKIIGVKNTCSKGL